jgi:hypothetical protein
MFYFQVGSGLCNSPEKSGSDRRGTKQVGLYVSFLFKKMMFFYFLFLIIFFFLNQVFIYFFTDKSRELQYQYID